MCRRLASILSSFAPHALHQPRHVRSPAAELVGTLSSLVGDCRVLILSTFSVGIGLAQQERLLAASPGVLRSPLKGMAEQAACDAAWQVRWLRCELNV